MSSMPWLAHYDPDVPASLAPYEPTTLVEVLRRRAAERPDAAVMRFEGAVTTFAELVRQAEAFAHALESLGVRRGDRVALLLPNLPVTVVAEVGAWMAGAIVTPMNPLYPEEELVGLLSRSGATLAVVLAPFYDRVDATRARTKLRRIVVAHVRDELDFAKSVLFRLVKERKDGHGTQPRGEDLSMRQLLHRHDGERPSAAPPRPEEPALLLPSGGTTGTPKLVMGTHDGLAIAGRQIFAWLRSVLEPWKDTLLVPLPLFHVYAAAGVLPLSFTAGLAMSLVPNPREIRSLLATLRRDRPAFLCAVPTLLSAIMAHKDAGKSKDAFQSVKLCFSGGAPLLAETRRRFEQLTGGIVMEGYSLTEGQMAVIGNPARGDKKIGSVGMPLPDVLLRLVDVETGTREITTPGESGEVLLHAPQIMQGYWEQPEETASVFSTDAEGRRWLHTGDIGHLDEDGYLFLTDRKKELIKVSGYQVWPREVEEVLVTHEAVLEAGVAPVPHPQKGEIPKAWVVLRPGASVAPQQLRAYCREHLAPYKVPGEVVIVPELPKTPVGKVLRRKLRDIPVPLTEAAAGD